MTSPAPSNTAMTSPAVIVMARAPRLGEGKARLRPALSAEACLQLQQAFLNDAVQVALEADLGAVYLAVTPASAAGQATAEYAGRATVIPQEGDGLGERMLAALQRVESAGHAPLVMIGTDLPCLGADQERQEERAGEGRWLDLRPHPQGHRCEPLLC